MGFNYNDLMKINDNAQGASVDSGFEYKLGMDVGLIDPLTYSKDDIRWGKIQYIEPDEELCIAFLYIVSDTDAENTKVKILPNGSPLMYMDIIDSISDLIVIP